MKISENKFVSLAYTLTVDGQVADQATADRPLEFVYGVGMLLPKFEEFIAGKEVGDKFEFVLTPAEGYGEINPQAVVNLPKDVFMVDGAIPDDMLIVGNVLPMAGKTLNFTGDVLGVREATPEDMMPMGGGCSCGCGCDGGDCDGGDCGDGCGCHH